MFNEVHSFAFKIVPPRFALSLDRLVQDAPILDRIAQVGYDRSMLPDVDLEAQPLKPCAAVDDPFTSDLTWLMHRAVKVLTENFDAACQESGLRDMRDTLVLATAGDGTPRTQIEIATTLGLDKSTLMSIIDRLEEQGYLVREADPANRRIRIPRTTKAGHEVLGRALTARDRAVDETLSGFVDGDVGQLRTLLWKIATAE